MVNLFVTLTIDGWSMICALDTLTVGKNPFAGLHDVEVSSVSSLIVSKTREDCVFPCLHAMFVF